MTVAFRGMPFYIHHNSPSSSIRRVRTIGHGTYSAAQRKIIQEVITLVVFAGFSVLVLREQLTWNYLVAFGLIVVAVFFVFKEW